MPLTSFWIHASKGVILPTASFAEVRLLARVFSIRINAALSPMTDSNQTDLLDGMIARLEKANSSAYERFAHQRETALKSEQEEAPEPSDQRPPIAPERQSPRARPLFVGLLALTLAASVCVTAFAREPSYVEAVKAFVRWANPWGSGALSQAQMTPKAGATVTPPISPEVPQHFQKMADDLANVEQQKASQEEAIRSDAAISERFKADNAKAIEQLNAALAQITLKNDAVAEQLKTSQEQLAELASSRAMASTRKHVRRSRSPMAPLKLHR
jgi:hypothetical protein